MDGVRRAIAALGASILYLSPYSPDLNPSGASRRLIRPTKWTRPGGRGGEQLFAKLKAPLRKSAARTKKALWSTIGHLLDSVPPGQRANYLCHCGYGSI